jgi:hypothetical protein
MISEEIAIMIVTTAPTDDDDDDDDDDKADFVPFVRWKGTLDTRVNKDKKNKVKRSGFCTILSPEFPLGGKISIFLNG